MIIGVILILLIGCLLVGIISVLVYVGVIPNTENYYMKHIYNFTATLVDSGTCDDIMKVLDAENLDKEKW